MNGTPSCATTPRALTAVAVILATCTACSDPVGPPEHVNPRLRGIGITEFETLLRDGGSLFIDAVPVDLAFRLAPEQRIPVEAATSSGDTETIEMFRDACPPRERTNKYRCFQFTVTMEQGHHADELAERLAAFGGRMYGVASGASAQVMLFSPDESLRRARDARSWPGVSWAGPSGLPACADWLPGFEQCVEQRPAILAGPIPVDTGAAAPGDGILQVRSGDMIRIAYPQPGLGILRDSVVVP